MVGSWKGEERIRDDKGDVRVRGNHPDQASRYRSVLVRVQDVQSSRCAEFRLCNRLMCGLHAQDGGNGKAKWYDATYRSVSPEERSRPCGIGVKRIRISGTYMISWCRKVASMISRTGGRE